MSRRLPPLNSLKAFDAAARHLSFTRAADELFVTQAAVSHQIKSLEEFLGIKLFIRRSRTLLLTHEGQAYWPSIRKMFEQLGVDLNGITRLEMILEPNEPVTILIERQLYEDGMEEIEFSDEAYQLVRHDDDGSGDLFNELMFNEDALSE